MRNFGRLVGGGLLIVSLVLCSCEDSHDAGRSNPTDPGILADHVAYQPAAVEGKLGGTGSGDADSQVRVLVGSMTKNLKEGFVEPALRLFNEQHVALLLEEDKLNELIKTADVIDRVARKLEGAGLKAFEDARLGGGSPKWEILGESATVTPNLALTLIGNARKATSVVASRSPSGWKFQLNGPLTADDVTAILAYHTQIQKSLNDLYDRLDAGVRIESSQLLLLFAKLFNGEEIELPPMPGAAADDAAADKPADDPNSAGEAKPTGGPIDADGAKPADKPKDDEKKPADEPNDGAKKPADEPNDGAKKPADEPNDGAKKPADEPNAG